MAVDGEVIAVVDGASLKAGEIRAGARLREALGPDFFSAEDRGQVPSLLLVGAPVDDGRPHEAQAHVARQHRGACRGVFLVPDHALDQRRAATTVFRRPRDPDPARLVHRPLPAAPTLERFAIGGDAIVGRIVEAQLGRQVGVEPRTKLPAERVLRGRVLEVHFDLLRARYLRLRNLRRR